jgi:hypothetical protein
MYLFVYLKTFLYNVSQAQNGFSCTSVLSKAELVFWWVFINLFLCLPQNHFVKILYVCVKMLKVWYSSHFVDLLFFDNIMIVLLLKSSRIFPVVYMLLIRQYKVRFVSLSSAGMLSIPYACFDFSSFNAFSNYCLCNWWTQFFGGNLLFSFQFFKCF